jgi:hypothetical protein
VNRTQRRAAARAARRGDDVVGALDLCSDGRTRIELYRVPPGHVALTLDVHDRPPSTVLIPVATFGGVLDGVGAIVGGKTYHQVLQLFAAAIAAADAGDPDACNAGLIGFWLALNHPSGGAEMAAGLADAVAPRVVHRRHDWRGTIAKCLQKPGDLRRWEREFLLSLSGFPRMSEKQRTVLATIAERVLRRENAA